MIVDDVLTLYSRAIKGVKRILPMERKDIRVLFADDHKVMRQGLVNLFAGQPGVQVAGEASSGQEAIELIRKLKPDAVVTDISMPEMDGEEATRRIKAQWPEVRVIGLSMLEDEYIVSAMRKAAAETRLSKTLSAKPYP